MFFLCICLSFFTEDYLYFSSMTLTTYIFIIFIPIVSKRSSFLLATPNNSKGDLLKISFAYALAINIEWFLIIHLREAYLFTESKDYKSLYSMLLLENVMSAIRITVNYLKYTLSLWCNYSNYDFRIKFSRFSFIKNLSLILGFIVSFIIRSSYSLYLQVFPVLHLFSSLVILNCTSFKSLNTSPNSKPKDLYQKL